MAAKIIDGKALAAQVKGELRGRAAALAKKHGRKPGIAVVLVGDNPASQAYVRNKIRDAEELGFYAEKHELPENTPEKKVMALVERLNKDAKIDGFLVQLPLPKHINAERVTQAVLPEKDIDGLTAVSQGRLAVGMRGHVACTPRGIMRIIDSVNYPLEGKEAVVIGRSNIVGKPVALLLLERNCTVTICHSRTKDLGKHTKRADVLVVAVGKPGLITKDMVKAGAMVIDVGTTKVGDRLRGDVDFEKVREIAGWITPMPGGVGPMTRACLLENALDAAGRAAERK